MNGSHVNVVSAVRRRVKLWRTTVALAKVVRRTLASLTIGLLMAVHPAAAQQPPRPIDSPRAVTLPLAEYNRLLDLASRPPADSGVPPVAAVLSSADLRVRVDRDTVRGVFTLDGNALRSGVNRVALLSAATLIDASANGTPLPLVADGNAHTALIPGPGPFTLALEWGAALTYAPGRASFVLPVPQAGTARARFDVPGDQADVRLSSGIITRKSVVDGRTIVEATLDPGSTTEVWWAMRDSVPTAATREVRTLSDVFTLITLSDSDVRMVSLVDVTVVQGELRTVAVRLPAGYEATGVSGSSLESSEPVEGGVVLTVAGSSARSHQFLISLERPHGEGSFSVETDFVSVRDVQRERGEVAIEGVGTLELTTSERDPLRRIDVREIGPALQQLARLPLLSAFRYQRLPGTAVTLTLGVTRFDDAGVLAAVADRGVVTTLVTSEGRALTEIVLTVQNRAQPFLKVMLPAGATMVSVDVAGETAKPALGSDGTRVPLLRPGFRPSGPYQVSFVYLHAGTPFAKKGEIEVALPKMDMPIGIVEWELFAPERYSMRAIGGNVIDARTVDAAALGLVARRIDDASTRSRLPVRVSLAHGGVPGQIRGRAVDTAGSQMPGVTVEMVTPKGVLKAITDANGAFVVQNVPSGPLTVTASLAGFVPAHGSFEFDQRPLHLDIELAVAGLNETIIVSADGPRVDVQRTTRVPPSSNVIELQRRAAGVLPVRVDVPRAGTSHMFVKPLVVDQEAVVKLRYKRRS